MIKQQKLEDLISESISLKPTSTGWNVCKCPLCSDYKERGGFKFVDNTVIYSCFNCGKTSKYEEFTGALSRNMRTILHAFGLDDSSIDTVLNTSFFNKKPEESGQITMQTLKKISTATPVCALPQQAIKLGSTSEHLEVQQKIVDYLLCRNVDLDRYNFFFSMCDRMKDRVIVPFYRNGQMIYWQARSILASEKKRYDNALVARDAVFFNMDELAFFNPAPLFVCEGVFDAMMFNGIATLGSKLSDAKIELMSKSNRRLVFVIDKDKNGASCAQAALKTGWEITFTPDGTTDLNNSVGRFGRAWTALELIKNIPIDHASAQIAISLNCRK